MKKREKEKAKLKGHKIYWASLSSFLLAISGWTFFNFWKEGAYIFSSVGSFLLIISPLVGIVGIFRNSNEKNKQFKRFKNYLCIIGIITSFVFWILMLIRALI
jgi:hypothetical protein